MSIGKHKMIAALCGIIVPFVSYISYRVVNEIGTDIHRHFSKERISSEKKLELQPAPQVVCTDVTEHPMLMLVCSGGWTVPQIKFAVYSDSQVVWADSRSPTGYCTARIPQKKQEEMLSLAKNIMWGKHYDVANVSDQPGYKIQFGTNETTIYGDPNSDYDYGQGERPAMSVPKPLLALLNLLQSFDCEPAKPWLPNEVEIEILSESGSADPELRTLPKRLYLLLPKDKSQRAGHKDSQTINNAPLRPHIHIVKTVSTLQYKDELLELITTPRNHRREVQVDGVPCRLDINVPGERLWTL